MHSTACACIRHAYALCDACQQMDLLVLEGALHAPYETGRIGMRVRTSISGVSRCEVTLSTTCLGLQ
jgi:hypothetical protein